MNKTHKNIDDYNNVIDFFLTEESIPKEEKPRCAILTGGPGSGKTTYRKENLPKEYAVIDANEIFMKIRPNKEAKYEDFKEVVNEIGLAMTERAIKEKRNFVIEISGGTDETDLLHLALSRLDHYQIEVHPIFCDIKDAYVRHHKATVEDPDYLSSYYTENTHIIWVVSAILKLFL